LGLLQSPKSSQKECANTNKRIETSISSIVVKTVRVLSRFIKFNVQRDE